MKKLIKKINTNRESPNISTAKYRRSVNDEVIKMKFLEQSAKYLGIYVENRPADYLYSAELTNN